MTNRLFLAVLIILVQSCNYNTYNSCQTKSLQVTATAFNSLAYQTNANPSITAFGDTLKPGLKHIAVSRDLLDSGLTHLTEVKIEGLEGTFLVTDKMNKRWRQRIDIYMGIDEHKAKLWGKKKVTISYCIPEKDTIY